MQYSCTYVQYLCFQICRTHAYIPNNSHYCKILIPHTCFVISPRAANRCCIRGVNAAAPVGAVKVCVCYSMLQSVAVCCSVLQCVAVCCKVCCCIRGVNAAALVGAMQLHVVQYVAVCCSVLKCVVVCYSMMQCVAVC